MSELRRKSNLREAFSASLKSKQRVNVGRLSARYLFRTAIRLVIEYKEWIGDEMSEQIGDDVNFNVRLAKRKKSDQVELTVKDRSILLLPPHKRSKEDVAHLEILFREIKAFKRYSDDVQELLASDCYYQYLPAGRTLIRQNHEARLLYYVVRGDLQILQNVVDDVTGEIVETEVGLLSPGDVIGEIALLHRVPRAATVVSKTPVDLLLVTRSVFDDNLRNVLLEEWDVLRDALANFNYFKGWTDATMRECFIMSKIISFKPNEVLLGDGKGMVHYVYFILSGECRLIEHMLVEKIEKRGQVRYKLYDSNHQEPNPRQRINRSKKLNLSNNEFSAVIMENTSQREGGDVESQTASVADYIKMIATKKADTTIAMDRISVITVTLQDVINQWHEITDVVEMLMKQPSVTSLQNYPKNVETIFMQICTFYRGACFGVGEQMKNRRVVAITPTKCLLIPRYWLTQHNRANIWERVKQFMNSKYPSNKQLFNKFIENRLWDRHKRDYAENIIENGRRVPNDTKMYDVPYSIRINEDIIDK